MRGIRQHCSEVPELAGSSARTLRGFSKLAVALLGDPYSKADKILGSVVGSPHSCWDATGQFQKYGPLFALYLARALQPPCNIKYSET